MEQQLDPRFPTREARAKKVSRRAQTQSREFSQRLSNIQMVDVYIQKLKTYKVGKIIERKKNGFYILLDGYGEYVSEDNVIPLVYTNRKDGAHSVQIYLPHEIIHSGIHRPHRPNHPQYRFLRFQKQNRQVELIISVPVIRKSGSCATSKSSFPRRIKRK